MKKIILLILLTGWLANADDVITARVISVIDGNTLQIQDADNKQYKVMLFGVDSPELTQDYGTQAKAFLEKLILHREVTVQFHGTDRQGNIQAIVTTADDTDLRVELLKEGLAWTAEKNAPAELEPYKTWARKKEKGLWKEKDPTPPWVHRKQLIVTNGKG